MTINDKHLEPKPEKGGDHHVAGTPITNTEDNEHQKRQENLTAMKAYRFTKGDNPFTIDMGNGDQVVDKRPIQQDSHTQLNNAAGVSKDQISITGDKGLGDKASPRDDMPSEASNRPSQPDKHYNDKDHLWHDNNSNEVVPPPYPPLYGMHAAEAIKDCIDYANHVRMQIMGEKETAPGSESEISKFRPTAVDGKTYNPEDKQWHDSNNKVTEPPSPEKYSGFGAGAIHAIDEARYLAWKMAHPFNK